LPAGVEGFWSEPIGCKER